MEVEVVEKAFNLKSVNAMIIFFKSGNGKTHYSMKYLKPTSWTA